MSEELPATSCQLADKLMQWETSLEHQKKPVDKCFARPLSYCTKPYDAGWNTLPMPETGASSIARGVRSLSLKSC